MPRSATSSGIDSTWTPGTTDANIVVGQPTQPGLANGCRRRRNRAVVSSPSSPPRSARNPVPMWVVLPIGLWTGIANFERVTERLRRPSPCVASFDQRGLTSSCCPGRELDARQRDGARGATAAGPAEGALDGHVPAGVDQGERAVARWAASRSSGRRRHQRGRGPPDAVRRCCPVPDGRAPRRACRTARPGRATPCPGRVAADQVGLPGGGIDAVDARGQTGPEEALAVGPARWLFGTL